VAPKEALDELVRAVGNAKSTEDRSMSEEDLGKIWPFYMRYLRQSLYRL